MRLVADPRYFHLMDIDQPEGLRWLDQRELNQLFGNSIRATAVRITQ